MTQVQDATRPVTIAGLDIGGTKTHLRVESGGRVIDRVFPTADWRDPHDPADVSGLGVLAEELRRAGSISSDALGVGAHGCDNPSQVAELTAALRTVHDGPLVVVNDADLVVPAAGRREGIAVIAGTGSIVVGHDASGDAIVVGGLGWLLADPGSAPSIAREAVRAVFERVDRTGDPGALGRALFARFGVADVHELSDAFTKGAGISAWGDIAPLVFDVASASGSGSRAAAEDDALTVIEAEAARLAAGVDAAVRRGAVGTAVIAAGGVIANQPLLERAFASALSARLPDHTFAVLRDPPVGGAIALARGLGARASS